MTRRFEWQDPEGLVHWIEMDFKHNKYRDDKSPQWEEPGLHPLNELVDYFEELGWKEVKSDT